MTQFLEGTVIAKRYILGRLLGRGGMGVVHLAYDRELARNVAIKMIAPTRNREPYEVRRFQLEALSLASIQSPHVVALHAFGRSQQICYYAMDYIEGATVEQVVARRRSPLLLESVLATMRDVARGLECVHRAGFIHRDVKPGNIFVENRTQRAVLFDFGLVLPWRTSDGKESGSVGSPCYMAPEQGAAALEPGTDEIGPWTDEYALACTGFEMLAGRPPYDGDCVGDLLRMHMLMAPPALSAFRPELHALDPVFKRALAKAPAERYGNATAMVEALGVAQRQRTGLFGRIRALLPHAAGPHP